MSQWRNKHKLMHFEENAVAGKTGYTKRAGRTLVTYFEKDRKRNNRCYIKSIQMIGIFHVDLANKVFADI